MTDNNHPITLPQEMLKQWRQEAPKYRYSGLARDVWIAAEAAQWGYEQRDVTVPQELQKARDEELDACCDWLLGETEQSCINALRAARRPKPKTLAEEALQSLDHLNEAAQSQMDTTKTVDIIRRALDRLQELEGQGEA